MITVIAVCDICLYCIECVIHIPGLLLFHCHMLVCKPCNLNIVQQWVFDVIDTSSFKSPRTHIGTFLNCVMMSNIPFMSTSSGVDGGL